MITINHAFSGYVCLRVAMPLLRRHSAVTERALGWAAAMGAAMPDADIVTMMLFGRERYFSELWYAHRAASHSVLGTLLLSLLAAGLFYRLLGRSGAKPGAQAYLWLVGGFWFGGLIHLVGDLFTPGWALPLMWPHQLRVGGFRHIGWFTPYILWLFIVTLLLAWGLSALGRKRKEFRHYAGLGAWGIYALATWRWLHFMIVTRYESDSQWMVAQHKLLPETLIVPVTQGVGVFWRWITGY